MGCDIHMTLERKIGDTWHCIWDGDVRPRVHANNEWESPVVLGRNYRFFGRLAGVRDEGPDPKGVPDDVSFVTQFMLDSWEQDAHSHSWDMLEDFCRKHRAESTEEEAVGLVKDRLLGTDSEASKHAEWLFGLYFDEVSMNEYRVVYWFDN